MAESLLSTSDPNVSICCCKFASRSSNNPRNDSNIFKCNSPKYCFASLATFPEKELIQLTASILSFTLYNWDRKSAEASCKSFEKSIISDNFCVESEFLSSIYFKQYYMTS